MASAGSQFVLTLVLVRRLSPVDFGSFSFLLISAQFSWSLSSALFCAPLPVLLATQEGGRRERALRGTMGLNLLAALAAGVPFLAVALGLGLGRGEAAVFALFTVAALLRWFARAHAYALGEPARTIRSDVIFGVIVTGQAAVAWYGIHASLASAFAGLCLASVIAMLPFGAGHLRALLSRPSVAVLRDYGLVWNHSGWSLLGVLTTEATVNCHAYIVAIVYGPGSFAPVAASALVTRPLNVAVNALSEFERPRLASILHRSKSGGLRKSVRSFRLVLLAGWLVTAGLALVIQGVWPSLVFPPRYREYTLVVGTVLWLAVMLIRLLRAPESTLMQAAGAFRPLAFASVWSAGVSVIAVVAFMLALGPIWSIAGILLGEVLFASLTFRGAYRTPATGLAVPAGVEGS